MFAVPINDSGHRPVTNLKNHNRYIPYSHFKMEGLFLLKQTLQEGEYICKIDLKDEYFSAPLNQKSQKLQVSNSRMYSINSFGSASVWDQPQGYSQS